MPLTDAQREVVAEWYYDQICAERKTWYADQGLSLPPWDQLTPAGKRSWLGAIRDMEEAMDKAAP